MLNWLKNLWHDITGIPGDIVNWFMSIITAVESFLESLIQDVWHFLGFLQNLINQLFNEAWQFILSVYHWVQYVVNVWIPDVIQWATDELNRLGNWLDNLYNWAVSRIEGLATWAENELRRLTNWVIDNIWNPLYSLVTGAIHWIEHEGAFVFNLLTHPELLAQLIGKYLLGAWVFLLHRFAAPLGRWLMRSMLAAGSDVGSILEDIIAAIL